VAPACTGRASGRSSAQPRPGGRGQRLQAQEVARPGQAHQLQGDKCPALLMFARTKVTSRQRPDTSSRFSRNPAAASGDEHTAWAVATNGGGPCSAGRRLSHRPQERLDRVGASGLATGLGRLEDDLPGVSSELERLGEQGCLALEVVMDQRGVDARPAAHPPQARPLTASSTNAALAAARIPALVLRLPGLRPANGELVPHLGEVLRSGGLLIPSIHQRRTVW
jgi:hypothetical protein